MHSVHSPLGTMSTAADPDGARAAVSHLLDRASSYPCSAAAPAFARLAHSTSTFQLALDALLPVLDPPTPCELTDRILVAFILFALYAPHPITINPFKSVLFVTFAKEREQALAVAAAGGIAPNEPLVWVLWKILKGDGDDIGPYSPSALARSLLPPNFRATKLILDDALYHTGSDLDDVTYSYDPRAPTPAREYDSARLVTREEDARNEAIAHAMRLLLAARVRVLSLAEQRQLTPLLPALAATALITPPDLAPLAAHNPALAYALCSALLAAASGPASDSASASESDMGASTHPNPVPFLAALTALPPTLASFDVLGRLLSDPAPAARVRVRGDVLGPFVANAIEWLARAEREERAGRVADDRFAVGVQHLCRFYGALIKRGLVDPASDADSAAMAHFSLRHARFEEANALYRALALGRGEV
ncbi:hypothetical protein B0H15DRAFT_378887 [Mycena belliarum]|uniref:CCR4-NOT transcription complex subunit 11 n=1 Tax=Mycena belliarum TaxID=1033014 RepID=A0AAD6XMK6_9AGAR|nr:hypothetical protein B0H15DRAFT_378887 [Mycena belliae]